MPRTPPAEKLFPSPVLMNIFGSLLSRQCNNRSLVLTEALHCPSGYPWSFAGGQRCCASKEAIDFFDPEDACTGTWVACSKNGVLCRKAAASSDSGIQTTSKVNAPAVGAETSLAQEKSHSSTKIDTETVTTVSTTEATTQMVAEKDPCRLSQLA